MDAGEPTLRYKKAKDGPPTDAEQRGLCDAGRDEDGRENEGPVTWSPMSENPDMGHPIILG